MSPFDIPFGWFTHTATLIVGIGIGVILAVIFEWYTWAEDLLPGPPRDD